LKAFAAECAVVTYEFENVPVAPLTAIGATPLLPRPRALEVAQDRVSEKNFVRVGRTSGALRRSTAAPICPRRGRDRRTGDFEDPPRWL
jgi:hypothetical protein